MRKKTTRRGVTFIELLIASVIFFLALAGVMQAVWDGADFTTTGINSEFMHSITRRTVDKFVADVSNSNVANILTAVQAPLGVNNTLNEQNSVTTFSFNMNLGYDDVNSVILWSTPITYTWTISTDEVLDGIDNDGNGVIDDGFISRTDLGGTPRVLMSNVEYQGFRVGIIGNNVYVSILSRTKVQNVGEFDAAYSTIISMKN